MNWHFKTGPYNTPHLHFFTHYPHTSNFSLTWSYLLCPQLLCPQLLFPRPPSLPAFTNSSQLASLASGWKRVSPKKPAEKSPACAKPNRG